MENPGMSEKSSWEVLGPRKRGTKAAEEIHKASGLEDKRESVEKMAECEQNLGKDLDSGLRMNNEQQISQDLTQNQNQRDMPPNVCAKEKSSEYQIKIRKFLEDYNFCFGLVLGFLVCLLLVLVICRGDIHQDIKLFSKMNHKGSMLTISPLTLNSNKCYNLNKYQSGFAVSIDSQGECVWIFEESDCRGKRAQISSWTNKKEHKDLSLVGLAKNTLSIQNCYKYKE